jgi:ABC-type sugar transport system permease subunit
VFEGRVGLYFALPALIVLFMLIAYPVAYTGILSVSLLSQSLGVTILAILFFEVGTSAYLWAIVLADPIGSHVFEPAAVWNGLAVGVVVVQALAAVATVAATLAVQTRRRDFV